MKQAMIFLIVLSLLAGCKRPPDAYEHTLSVPDISDLAMSADLQKACAARRQKLAETIGNGVAVVRSDGDHDGGRHEFRATNNFYYLTGLNQYGYILTLSGEDPPSYSLFRREKSIFDVIYTGTMTESDTVMNHFGPDTLLPLQEFGPSIIRFILSGTPLYVDREDGFLRDSISRTIARLKASDTLLRNLDPLMDEMRVHKDETEIVRMQKAVDITGEAFRNACRVSRPGLYEFEVEAVIEYTFRKNGSSMPAFQSIVGSGPNAVTLHYTENIRQIRKGELLLMDIGAEYGHYCADITRTVPAGRKFTPEQRDIYELVLKGQKAAIAEMLPGNYLMAGHNRCTAVIARGLYGLGLLTDTASAWQKRFYTLYPISHFVGMDVHDAGDLGAPYPVIRQYMVSDTLLGRKLEQGMVLTVEPGLYFRHGGLEQLFEMAAGEASPEEIRQFIDQVAPAYQKYEGIGVRIEDDVLITGDGNRVLSGSIPKEPDDIEKLKVR